MPGTVGSMHVLHALVALARLDRRTRPGSAADELVRIAAGAEAARRRPALVERVEAAIARIHVFRAPCALGHGASRQHRKACDRHGDHEGLFFEHFRLPARHILTVQTPRRSHVFLPVTSLDRVAIGRHDRTAGASVALELTDAEIYRAGRRGSAAEDD